MIFYKFRENGVIKYVDADNNEIKLEDVEFKLYNEKRLQNYVNIVENFIVPMKIFQSKIIEKFAKI